MQQQKKRKIWKMTPSEVLSKINIGSVHDISEDTYLRFVNYLVGYNVLPYANNTYQESYSWDRKIWYCSLDEIYIQVIKLMINDIMVWMFDTDGYCSLKYKSAKDLSPSELLYETMFNNDCIYNCFEELDLEKYLHGWYKP